MNETPGPDGDFFVGMWSALALMALAVAAIWALGRFVL